MEKLEAGISREAAFALLGEHNKDPFHIEHGETVEGTLRYFAREFDELFDRTIKAMQSFAPDRDTFAAGE